MENPYQKEWQNVEITNFEPKIGCFFLQMFSIIKFHLEIVSANMTFTNQSMIIYVKDTYIYRRQCNGLSVENILRRNKNHGTLAKKQLNFFL